MQIIYQTLKDLAERFDFIIAGELWHTPEKTARTMRDRFGAEVSVTFDRNGFAVVSDEMPATDADPLAAFEPFISAANFEHPTGRLFCLLFNRTGRVVVEPERVEGIGQDARVKNLAGYIAEGHGIEFVELSEIQRRLALRAIAGDVRGIVDNYRNAKEEVRAKFAGSPSYAVSWIGGLFDAEEKAKWAVTFLEHIARSSDFADLQATVEQFWSYFCSQYTSSVRVPSSTSRFSNAVEIEQIEARFGLINQMSGLQSRANSHLKWTARIVETKLREKTQTERQQTADEAGLVLWNGRGDYQDFAHFYVAAKSAADAVRLLKKAGHSSMTAHELKTYYSQGTWGIAMDGIKPERGVWATRKGEGSTETAPERLV